MVNHHYQLDYIEMQLVLQFTYEIPLKRLID